MVDIYIWKDNMELNLKERAIIIYNLLWKYDSYVNLQTKESIKQKVDFTEEELEGIGQYTGVDGNVYTQFSDALDLETTQNYEFTENEIIYLADKIMVLNATNRLNDEGMSMYEKIENIYSQIQAEKGFTKIGPWQYANAKELNNNYYNG